MTHSPYLLPGLPDLLKSHRLSYKKFLHHGINEEFDLLSAKTEFNEEKVFYESIQLSHVDEISPSHVESLDYIYHPEEKIFLIPKRNLEESLRGRQSHSFNLFVPLEVKIYPFQDEFDPLCPIDPSRAVESYSTENEEKKGSDHERARPNNAAASSGPKVSEARGSTFIDDPLTLSSRSRTEGLSKPWVEKDKERDFIRAVLSGLPSSSTLSARSVSSKLLEKKMRTLADSKLVNSLASVSFLGGPGQPLSSARKKFFQEALNFFFQQPKIQEIVMTKRVLLFRWFCEKLQHLDIPKNHMTSGLGERFGASASSALDRREALHEGPGEALNEGPGKALTLAVSSPQAEEPIKELILHHFDQETSVNLLEIYQSVLRKFESRTQKKDKRTGRKATKGAKRTTRQRLRLISRLGQSWTLKGSSLDRPSVQLRAERVYPAFPEIPTFTSYKPAKKYFTGADKSEGALVFNAFSQKKTPKNLGQSLLPPPILQKDKPRATWADFLKFRKHKILQRKRKGHLAIWRLRSLHGLQTVPSSLKRTEEHRQSRSSIGRGQGSAEARLASEQDKGFRKARSSKFVVASRAWTDLRSSFARKGSLDLSLVGSEPKLFRHFKSTINSSDQKKPFRLQTVSNSKRSPESSLDRDEGFAERFAPVGPKVVSKLSSANVLLGKSSLLDPRQRVFGGPSKFLSLPQNEIGSLWKVYRQTPHVVAKLTGAKLLVSRSNENQKFDKGSSRTFQRYQLQKLAYRQRSMLILKSRSTHGPGAESLGHGMAGAVENKKHEFHRFVVKSGKLLGSTRARNLQKDLRSGKTLKVRERAARKIESFNFQVLPGLQFWQKVHSEKKLEEYWEAVFQFRKEKLPAQLLVSSPTGDILFVKSEKDSRPKELNFSSGFSTRWSRRKPLQKQALKALDLRRRLPLSASEVQALENEKLWVLELVNMKLFAKKMVNYSEKALGFCWKHRFAFLWKTLSSELSSEIEGSERKNLPKVCSDLRSLLSPLHEMLFRKTLAPQKFFVSGQFGKKEWPLQKDGSKSYFVLMNLGKMPFMTKQGNFLINGSARVLVSQIAKCPNFYTKMKIDSKGRARYWLEFVSSFKSGPNRWIQFHIDLQNRMFYTLGNKKKYSIFIFLGALGISPAEIPDVIEHWDFLKQSVHQETVRVNGELVRYVEEPLDIREARIQFYNSHHFIWFTGDEKTDEELQNNFEEMFYNPANYFLGHAGREALNQRRRFSPIPSRSRSLEKEDFLAAINALISVRLGLTPPDDIDHLKFRRVRLPGELLQNEFHLALTEGFSVDFKRTKNGPFASEALIPGAKDQRRTIFPTLEALEQNIFERGRPFALAKMAGIQSTYTVTPLEKRMRSFFHTGQLSQYMDQTNPLAELTHKRRLTSLGPDGLPKQVGVAVRELHPSHFGRICPIETPEGLNAGLVSSLSSQAQIGSNHTLLAPYYWVKDRTREFPQKIFNNEILDSTFLGTTPEIVQQIHSSPEIRLASRREALDRREALSSNLPVQRSPFSQMATSLLKYPPVLPEIIFLSASAEDSVYICSEDYWFSSKYKNFEITGLELPQLDRAGGFSGGLRPAPGTDAEDFGKAQPELGMPNQSFPVQANVQDPFRGSEVLSWETSGRTDNEKRQAGPSASRLVRQGEVLVDSKNSLVKLQTVFPARYKQEFFTVTKSQIDFFGICPTQMISVGTSLIPFLEHDDANRALMGSNMQRQALPLLILERPIVGTGSEKGVAQSSNSVLLSEFSGQVSFVDGRKIVVDSFPKTITSFSETSNTKYSRLLLGSFQTRDPEKIQANPVLLAEDQGQGDDVGFVDRRNLFTNFHHRTEDGKVKTIRRIFTVKIQSPKMRTGLARLGAQGEVSQSVKRSDPFRAKLDRRSVQDSVLVKVFPISEEAYQKSRNLLRRDFIKKHKETQRKRIFPQKFLKFLEENEKKKMVRVLKKVEDARKTLSARSGTEGLSKLTKAVTEGPSSPLPSPNSLLSTDTLKKVTRQIENYFQDWEGQPLPVPIVRTIEKIPQLKLIPTLFKKKILRKPIVPTKATRLFFEPTPQMIFKKILSKNSKTRGLLRKALITKNLPAQTTRSFQPEAEPKVCPSSEKISQAWTLKGSALTSAKRWPKNQKMSWSVEMKMVTPYTQVTYNVHRYWRTNQSTLRRQRPSVRAGDWVAAGDLLADSSATLRGEVCVGKNVLVGYVPWEGYNFEDAIVVNERLVEEDIYTSILIDRYEMEASIEGGEKITRDVPYLQEHLLKNLDPRGIVSVGTWVEEDDILVGKIAPVTIELVGYKKLFADIQQTPPPVAMDVSYRLPSRIRGRVLESSVTERIVRTPDNKRVATPWKVTLYLVEKRRLKLGDKMSGRHGNKGIVSIILPPQDMPFLPDGTPLDIALNPLGVPSRMNVGQLLESLLGLAGHHLEQKYRIPAFDEMYGEEFSRRMVYDKLLEAAQKSQKPWLFNPNFPGKMMLRDGRTGDYFHQPILVGYPYMLRLIHMVDDKMHARATGPYTMVTKQPLKGRANRGGQRIGEMEVWALEAFAASYALQELLTLKSDDITGRNNFLASFLKRKKRTVGGIPDAFRLLMHELQSLCFHVHYTEDYRLTYPTLLESSKTPETPIPGTYGRGS